MTSRMTFLMAVLAAALLLAPHPAPVRAEMEGIVAIVNDQPITELDLKQRIVLLEILGDLPRKGLDRQQTLQAMIDDQVKIVEATRFGMLPSDSEISERITRIAKGMNLTRDQLMAKLKDRGISEASFRRYLQASIGFSRLVSAKYKEDVKVTDAEVDAKMAEIKAEIGSETAKLMSDPRMKPVTVYSLMEIELPIDSEDPMMMQSRAIEARQVAERLKGCGSVRAASEGIFDVKSGKKFDVDAAKMPKELRQALDKAGVGRAVGPVRSKKGIQLIAFCGSRTITPPKPDFKMPTREQIERMVINERYDSLEAQYLEQARDKVYVEYRDAAYTQQ